MGAVDTLGHHIVVDASGCDPYVIDDVVSVEQIMLKAAELAGLRVKASEFSRFDPCGVSGFVLVYESHISVHTWPEDGYAALDVYTCGDFVRAIAALDYILDKFGAVKACFTGITRGIIDREGRYVHSVGGHGASKYALEWGESKRSNGLEQKEVNEVVQ